MELYAYLAQREKELLEKIDYERRQITLHQLKIVPLEGELADVRRAKAMTGMFDSEEPHVNLGTPGSGTLAPVEGDLPTLDAPPAGYFATAFASPYNNMTMKDLVLNALGQHFQSGATRSELINFFRDAWNRKIEPSSLSPQLSRLLNEGKISYREADHRWLPGDGVLLSMPIGVFRDDSAADTNNEETGSSDELARAITEAKLRSIVDGERPPENQAVLDALKKLKP
jgi:hypothetical protein